MRYPISTRSGDSRAAACECAREQIRFQAAGLRHPNTCSVRARERTVQDHDPENKQGDRTPMGGERSTSSGAGRAHGQSIFQKGCACTRVRTRSALHPVDIEPRPGGARRRGNSQWALDRRVSAERARTWYQKQRVKRASQPIRCLRHAR